MGGGIFLEGDFGDDFGDDFGGAFFAFAAGFFVTAIYLPFFPIFFIKAMSSFMSFFMPALLVASFSMPFGIFAAILLDSLLSLHHGRNHLLVVYLVLGFRLFQGTTQSLLVHAFACGHFFPLFSTLVDYTLLQTTDALTDPEV